MRKWFYQLFVDSLLKVADIFFRMIEHFGNAGIISSLPFGSPSEKQPLDAWKDIGVHVFKM